MLTRRRLLEGSIAALLASASGGCNDMGSGRRVVVVGAGLSGLNAALILERWGFEVDVVEAKTRARWAALDAGPPAQAPPKGGATSWAPITVAFFTWPTISTSPLRTPPRTLPSDYCIGDQRITRDSWASAAANPLPRGMADPPTAALDGESSMRPIHC